MHLATPSPAPSPYDAPIGFPTTLGAFSVFALGVVVGYLLLVFVFSLDTKTLRAFVGFLAAILGGVVITFITTTMGADKKYIAWYPIGLLAGLVVWALLRVIGKLWNVPLANMLTVRNWNG